MGRNEQGRAFIRISHINLVLSLKKEAGPEMCENLSFPSGSEALHLWLPRATDGRMGSPLFFLSKSG